MVTQCRERGIIMAKLSKANLYAIQWLNSQSKTAPEIAKELALTEKQVNSVLEKNSIASEKNNIKIAKSTSRSQNLMIRETAGKKNNSVAIMTGEASMLNDELKHKTKNTDQPKTDKYIFRPKK